VPRRLVLITLAIAAACLLAATSDSDTARSAPRPEAQRAHCYLGLHTEIYGRIGVSCRGARKILVAYLRRGNGGLPKGWNCSSISENCALGRHESKYFAFGRVEGSECLTAIACR